MLIEEVIVHEAIWLYYMTYKTTNNVSRKKRILHKI